MVKKNMSIKKPMLLVFAGPNGSGKSTFTQYFEKLGEYTNADDVVASTGISNIDAAKLVDENRYAAIKERKDLTIETVLSSKYKLDLLKYAKREGYFIKCFFILTTDPTINIARVDNRVALGGHAVEKEKIISRYYKSLSNIKELMNLCDIIHVYDNTTAIPVRIIRKHKKDVTIYPNKYWSQERILELLN